MVSGCKNHIALVAATLLDRLYRRDRLCHFYSHLALESNCAVVVSVGAPSMCRRDEDYATSFDKQAIGFVDGRNGRLECRYLQRLVRDGEESGRHDSCRRVEIVREGLGSEGDTYSSICRPCRHVRWHLLRWVLHVWTPDLASGAHATWLARQTFGLLDPCLSRGPGPSSQRRRFSCIIDSCKQ